ncbi:MAG: C40 family peptidase [Lachnospiraceae bacterium]|nr:C40 family peptidase [Lachnospiraceae bacterium]
MNKSIKRVISYILTVVIVLSFFTVDKTHARAEEITDITVMDETTESTDMIYVNEEDETVETVVATETDAFMYEEDINLVGADETSDNAETSDETEDDSLVDGNAVVALAESYIGKVPYVTGGNSLETGTDCSGFVILIYNQFGLDISKYRSTRSMFSNADKYGISLGTDLSLARPGDLVFTNSGGHVGIIKNSEELVHQTVPGSSVKVDKLKYMGEIIGIVRPYILKPYSDGNIQFIENSYSKVVLRDNYVTTEAVEYKWTASGEFSTGSFNFETEWSENNYEYTFYLPKTGIYEVSVEIRKKGDESGEVLSREETNFYHANAVKGKCQMPYWGEEGGYLIGVESYENPNQAYTYQMLILDCTLLAQGLPAWTFATDPCGVPEENAFWVIWQPQYGYYWTLFRVYDENGNLIGEECYGFVNAY